MRSSRRIGDGLLALVLLLAAFATVAAVAAKVHRHERIVAERVDFARATAGLSQSGGVHVRHRPSGDIVCARFRAEGQRCVTFAPDAAIVVSERATAPRGRRG